MFTPYLILSSTLWQIGKIIGGLAEELLKPLLTLVAGTLHKSFLSSGDVAMLHKFSFLSFDLL